MRPPSGRRGGGGRDGGRRLRPALAGAFAAALLGLPGTARAQLPSASARALGMGENYSALARGYNAVAWNPAGLGVPDGPGFSMAFPVLQGALGLDPVTLGDLAEHDGEMIPAGVKADWLDRIRAEGSQEGTAGGGITWVAMSIENFAVQLSTVATGTASLTPEGAELLLFGNAGASGEPRDLRLGGSRLDAAATSTVALSYATPLSLRIGNREDQRFAVGATVTYTVGHVLLRGRDEGSAASVDPLEVSADFPVVQTDTALEDLTNGDGFGLDVGALWEGGPWRGSVAVHNVVSSFSWDVGKLFFRPGTALFDADTTASDFDAIPLSEAPFQFRREVDDLDYPPVARAGVALEATRRVTVSADVRRRFGDGIDPRPRTHLGIGSEYRLPALLSLQGGVAAITDGYQLTGGAALSLGPFHVSASGARRETELGTDGVGMFALTFKTR